MDADELTSSPSSQQRDHVGPPDLILQAIIPPTDAPAEIRAAVADALARRDAAAGSACRWEDVSFAASVVALVEGTNRRAEPDMQWAFALTADAPRLGEQLQNTGAWASTLVRDAHGSGVSRVPWRISVFDSVTTTPRQRPDHTLQLGP
jgi:hypothetical protein